MAREAPPSQPKGFAVSYEVTDALAKAATVGALCVLTDPQTGAALESDGQPVGLILAGEDSEQFQKRDMELARQRSKDAEKAGRKWRYTPEMQQENSLELLVACTLGWQGLRFDGSEEFTKDRVREMYRKVRWIREQADAFVQDRTSFGGASPTT